LIVATGTSTLFSLFWPFPPDEAKQLNMSHLADGGLGALFVWCYVLLWFVRTRNACSHTHRVRNHTKPLPTSPPPPPFAFALGRQCCCLAPCGCRWFHEGVLLCCCAVVLYLCPVLLFPGS
jgi:hypothetical protein